MTVGRLLLWRHGRTAYNASARLQGQVDIPLDDVGRWQARTAAAAMLARHTPTRVVSSDLGRATQTAEALARMVGVPVELDARLRERGFGEWEGLTGDEIAARWPEDHAVWRAGGEPTRVGAESRSVVAARTGEAIRELAGAMDRTQVLVVVSHGAAISSAVAELLGMPADWRAIAGMHNAHWAELVPSSGDVHPAWRLAGYGLGPTDASRDWDAGPDREDDVASTRDPD
ncbi:phosphoglycerate mutase family protein [Cellulomonas sp. DKR-3]|uniref:Phosphoglycerate mutase family protein n=1 Tax=Cellulomonas fulva TaxID=2835530 RepID=A0ABS5TZX0_9CELL|nr:histidine phosphatase family protein [Cellulomonas fulva]MBT0994695.1 phosphoglycerate mutase family protein [Cellulomonas fulva]